MRVSEYERHEISSNARDLSVRKEALEVETEVGAYELASEEFEKTKLSLEQIPPVSFDVARLVRVFHPYIQYVTISLEGCAIQRRKVKMPRSVLDMGESGEILDRLHTTFDLIEKNSSVSSKTLEADLDEIRKNFTRSLGKPWGRVLLRARRDDFDKRIEAFRERLKKHQEKVRDELQTYIDSSRASVVEYYLPIVMERPPDALLGQITSAKPSEDQAKAWLNQELEDVFPSAESVTKEMTLQVHFQDVTYETLTQDGFGEKLRKVYPHVDWDKPFHEFQAPEETQRKDGRAGGVENAE